MPDDIRKRLFAGVFPMGISYADRSRSDGSDYHRVAFLPFKSLHLEVYDHDSPLLPMIRDDAAAIIERKGEEYKVSTCGQTVTLGK